MKNLFIFLIVISGNLLAQSYQPFDTTNGQWRQVSKQWFSPNMDQYDYIYFISGDTISSGKTYHKLYKTEYYSGYQITMWGPTLVYGPVLSNANQYAGAFREDASKRVYFLADTTSNEQILYDFNLNVGDTLPEGYNTLYIVNKVHSIDSILIGSVYHKRFNICDADNPSNIYTAIVEGIGSVFGFKEKLVTVFEHSDQLLCYSHNGNIEYMDPGAFGCELPSGVGIQELSRNEMRIFPNPSFGEFKITTPNNNETAIHISDISGRIILTVNNPAFEEHINLCHADKGIYFIRSVSATGQSYRQKIIIH